MSVWSECIGINFNIMKEVGTLWLMTNVYDTLGFYQINQ